MVTADTVKTKIRNLITKANTITSRNDQTLTPAVNALIAGYGQGGGGFIDVTELPTENINTDAVYRITTENASIYLMSEGTLLNYSDMMIQAGATVEIYIVGTLPASMKISDAQTAFYIYIINSTGIAYLSMDGTPDNALPFGALMGAADMDKGWVSSIENITDDGIYTLKEINERLYRSIDGNFKELIVEADALIYTYSPSDNCYMVKYNPKSNEKNIVVPATFDGLPVKIEMLAFAASPIQTIVIENGVTFIGENAFINCHSLKSCSIPDTITYAGSQLFDSCYSLGCEDNEIIAIGTDTGSNISIADMQFANCYAIKKITVPEGVKVLNAAIFANCHRVEEITLPSTTYQVCDNCFVGCTNLRRLNINSPTPPIYGSDENNPFDIAHLQNSLVINVPLESQSAYRSANGWSQLADKIATIG